MTEGTADLSSPEGDVSAATLDLCGTVIQVYYVVVAYPTELAARQAWERCDRLTKKKGELLSVYRVLDPDAGWMVVALSEDEAPVRSARRRLQAGGSPHEMSREQLKAFYLRRARVTVARGPTSGEVSQRARYGRAGARLTQDGRLRPLKRPQG
jgi:hypothetical protein